MKHRVRPAASAARSAAAIYDLLPQDHRLSYDMRHVLECLLDGGELDEFQPGVAREMICGHAHIEGWPVAVIANQRGVIKGRPDERPRFGGIVYTGSAEKVAYFIDTANRERLPILFVQDVSGFMVGPEAEHSGIIRAGAHFVEAMATALVPKIVLTVNHASGAGYYAMAGQGFDPDFILSWPTGRMGVMEGESAVMAVHGPEIDRAQRERRELAPEVKASVDSMRADYEAQLDARTPPPAVTSTPSSRPRRPATCWPSRSASAPTTPGPTSGPSCFRRSTRPSPARNACDRPA